MRTTFCSYTASETTVYPCRVFKGKQKKATNKTYRNNRKTEFVYGPSNGWRRT